MPISLEQIQSMLDDIDSANYVSDWEADYVDQMLKLTDAGQFPSDKQIEKIKEII